MTMRAPVEHIKQISLAEQVRLKPKRYFFMIVKGLEYLLLTREVVFTLLNFHAVSLRQMPGPDATPIRSIHGWGRTGNQRVSERKPIPADRCLRQCRFGSFPIENVQHRNSVQSSRKYQTLNRRRNSLMRVK